MREVRIRPRAQLDIESIFIYIALELKEPQAAQGVVDALYAAFERAADLPELGTLFASDDLDREYRRTLVKNYWVYYTFDDAELTVWRVFHTRQDIANYALVDF